MTFSLKRIKAIFVKDYKDFSRNLGVSISLFVVPFLAAFYSRMGVESIELYYMLFNLGLAMVATLVQSCLIAEEKEKNTLRGLMLSPASTAEILLGKSLLSLLLTSFVIGISAIFLEYVPNNIWIITISMFISIVFYIGLGTLLGLYTNSVMEASVAVTPVMIVFGFGTFIADFVDKYPALKMVTYLPNIQLQEIALKVENSASFGDIVLHLFVIIVWVVIISALVIVVYRKRMVD